MAEFFAMGGYAGYVWSAYGVAAVVLVGLLVFSLRGLKAREAQLKALEERGPHRARRSAGRQPAETVPASPATFQTDAGS